MVPHRAKSSSSVSTSDSNPTATDLDKMELVDLISDLRTHFVPDAEATPALTTKEDPAGVEDHRAIEEMEAEYEGQDVSWDKSGGESMAVPSRTTSSLVPPRAVRTSQCSRPAW